MAEYTVPIDAEALVDDKIDDPDAIAFFADHLDDEMITISAGGGISLMRTWTEDDGTFHDAPYARIDAESDPTAAAASYDWSFVSSAEDEGTDLAAIQAAITAGGSATTTQLVQAIIGLARLQKLDLDYSP